MAWGYANLPHGHLESPCAAEGCSQISPFQHAAHRFMHGPKERAGDRALIAPGLNERVPLDIQQVLQVAVTPCHAAAGRSRVGVRFPALQVGKIQPPVESPQFNGEISRPADRFYGRREAQGDDRTTRPFRKGWGCLPGSSMALARMPMAARDRFWSRRRRRRCRWRTRRRRRR